MSANSAAHSAKGGFNQSGGAHFIVLTSLDNTHINRLATAGSNSGGAVVAPTFSAVAATDASIGLLAADVAAGKILKDMGRTIVSSGRTFRKFAAVGSGAARFNSSLGVGGTPASAPNAGFGTFYLEVGREGQGTAVPAPIARYL
jgi:hypothetical protein